MREIKFRAWNGMEMVYDVIVGRFGAFYVNPYNNGINEKDSACLTPFNTKYPDSVPIMQFTGLYDKDGKEIYEGDIVECADQKSLTGSRYIVRFNEESDCESGFSFGSVGWYREEIKVIGNIHEKLNREQGDPVSDTTAAE